VIVAVVGGVKCTYDILLYYVFGCTSLLAAIVLVLSRCWRNLMPVCGDFRVATQPCGVPVSSEKELSLVRSCHGFWAVMHIGSSHLAPSTTLNFEHSFLPPS
jgi:hypothetical protein